MIATLSLKYPRLGLIPNGQGGIKGEVWAMFRQLLVVSVVAAVGVAAAAYFNGFPNSSPTWWASDSLFDYVTTKEAVAGANAYQPLGVLLGEHSDVKQNPREVHPRAPGAFVLQLPLLAVPPSSVLTLQSAFIIASVTALIVMSVRLAGFGWLVAVPVAFVFFTAPVANAFGNGGQGPIVAALVTMSWWACRRSDSVGSGLPLAAAATLKLFPLILVPMLWAAGHRRTAVGAGVGFGILSLAGLLLPGVTLGAAIGAIVSAADVYRHAEFGNYSFVAALPFDNSTIWLSAVGSVPVVWWVWRHRPTLDTVFVLGMIAMLLLAPLVWMNYLTVLVPVLAVAAGLWSSSGSGRDPQIQVAPHEEAAKDWLVEKNSSLARLDARSRRT